MNSVVRAIQAGMMACLLHLTPCVRKRGQLERRLQGIETQLAALTREAADQIGQRESDAEIRQRNLEHALSLILGRAEAELAMLGANWDTADNRTYAFLAVNVAGGATLIANRDAIQPYWWALLIGLGSSTVLFLFTLWPRNFDMGPNLQQFYEKWGTDDPLTVKLHMFGELAESFAVNRKKLDEKVRPFVAGFVMLVLTVVIGGTIVGLTSASVLPW